MSLKIKDCSHIINRLGDGETLEDECRKTGSADMENTAGRTTKWMRGRHKKETEGERPLGYLCISRLLCVVQLHADD